MVVKAHAGGGKTILLQRIAWDAAHILDKLCLYVPPGVIDPFAIKSIVEMCKERVFLFVDDAPSRVSDLLKLFQEIGDAGKWLTVITSARTNEWNISGSPLSSYMTHEYELGYLSDVEIDQLLELLEKRKHSAEPSLARVVVFPRSPRAWLREDHYAWIRTASRSENAVPLVAPPDPTSARGKPYRRRVLPPTRRQHGDLLRLETPLPRGTRCLTPRA